MHAKIHDMWRSFELNAAIIQPLDFVNICFELYKQVLS